MSQRTCNYCNRPFNSVMRHCPFCNGEHFIAPTKNTPTCPRCAISLDPHRFRENDLDICPTCGGLWLDTQEFRRLTSERDVYNDDTVPYQFLKQPIAAAQGYLSCARCDGLMNRRNFKRISGIMYDECRDHGVWLDAGELDHIRAFIAAGGLDQAQDREIFQNSQDLQSLAQAHRETAFIQRVLNKWKFKRWLFQNF